MDALDIYFCDSMRVFRSDRQVSLVDHSVDTGNDTVSLESLYAGLISHRYI